MNKKERAKLERKLEKKLDKVTNKLREIRGGAKVKLGESTSQPDLVANGRSDQAHAAIASAKSDVVDASSHVKDAFEHLTN